MESSISRSINFEWCDIKTHILDNWSKKRVVVFIDSKVYGLDDNWNALEKDHQNLIVIPTNLAEGTKNLESLIACLERIENIRMSRRDDILLAIGGGALMDLVSLAANLYRRGIPVIKVPTTLLGFVDASIGIKTGINFLGQRNRLGSYYLNYDVLYDPSLLSSLSIDLIREGLGEIFKIAIIKSSELFELLEEHKQYILYPDFYQTEPGGEIISLSVELMLEELHDNPTESNLKRSVDFGHSFSPLIEMNSIQMENVDVIPHGLAVGADCVITSIISYNRGLLDEEALERIFSLSKVIDFMPLHPLYEHDEIMWSSMVEMTAHRSNAQNLPVPTSIGSHEFLQDLTFEEMKVATKDFRNYGKI